MCELVARVVGSVSEDGREPIVAVLDAEVAPTDRPTRAAVPDGRDAGGDGSAARTRLVLSACSVARLRSKRLTVGRDLLELAL